MGSWTIPLDVLWWPLTAQLARIELDLLFGAGFAAIFVLAGIVAVPIGLYRLWVVLSVLWKDLLPSAGLSPGPVAVAGSPERLRKPLVAPITGEECFAYEVEIKRLHGKGMVTTLESVAKGASRVRFLLDGEFGTVRVDPDGAELRLDRSDRFEVGAGESLAERVTGCEVGDDGSVGVQIDGERVHLDPDADYRFTEKRLGTEDTAHVIGIADLEYDDSNSLTIKVWDGTSGLLTRLGCSFVVKDERMVEERIGLLLNGIGITAGGALFLAVMWNPFVQTVSTLLAG